MTDYYRDTDHRMANDVEFRAAVHLLMGLAHENGFTPGELKQVAFRAALELEQRRVTSPAVGLRLDGFTAHDAECVRAALERVITHMHGEGG